jgi:arsenite methyltransferase
VSKYSFLMSNCCNISSEKPKLSSSSEIIGVVNAAYSARAREGVSAACAYYANLDPTLHLGFFIHESIYSYIDASNVAKAFGYTEEQLKSVPDAAHMGLSCGNPIATASIKEAS